MRKTLFAMSVVAAALLVAPSVALAGPKATGADKARAAKTCKNIKAAVGARTFSELFAPKARNARAANRNCARRQTASEHRNRENPEWKKECEPLKEQRTTGEPTETAPASTRNDYGQCVADAARRKSREDQEETINAAQECKRDRRADPAEFRKDHGGRPNAFAKCVREKKAQNDG